MDKRSSLLDFLSLDWRDPLRIGAGWRSGLVVPEAEEQVAVPFEFFAGGLHEVEEGRDQSLGLYGCHAAIALREGGVAGQGARDFFAAGRRCRAFAGILRRNPGGWKQELTHLNAPLSDAGAEQTAWKRRPAAWRVEWADGALFPPSIARKSLAFQNSARDGRDARVRIQTLPRPSHLWRWKI